MIITFQTKADTSGTDQISQQMESMKQKMQETAKSADGLAKSFNQFSDGSSGRGLKEASASVKGIGLSFNQLKSIIVGTALTLPLTGFIKEAIRSEEISARFSLQLRSIGQSINEVDIEGLTKKMHSFGFTQTDLVQGLTAGIRYFKDIRKETALLDTAIGITRVTGGSLASAFQQLGLVSLGYTRIARQLGVSTHSEIHDPMKKAAAVLEDITKKFAPLATGTGTTAESFKQLGATFKDTGEKIGAEFLAPAKDVADIFNKLSPATKELAIRTGLYAGAVFGLATAYNALAAAMARSAAVRTGTVFAQIGWLANLPLTNIKQLFQVISGIATALFKIPVNPITLAIIATLGAYTATQKWTESLNKNSAAKERAVGATNTLLRANLDGMEKEISMTEDLEERKKDLQDTIDILKRKSESQEMTLSQRKDASQELEKAKELLAQTIAFDELKKLSGIKTDEDLTKSYEKMMNTKAGYAELLAARENAYLVESGQLNTAVGQRYLAIINKQRQEAISEQKSTDADIWKQILENRLREQQRAFTIELATLRMSADQENAYRIKNAKDIAETQIQIRKEELTKELAAITGFLAEDNEKRKAATERATQDELDIRAKVLQSGFEKELATLLQSKEERAKMEETMSPLKNIVGDAQSLEQLKNALKDMDDKTREIAKTSEGQVMIKAKAVALSEQQAQSDKRIADAQMKYFGYQGTIYGKTKDQLALEERRADLDIQFNNAKKSLGMLGVSQEKTIEKNVSLNVNPNINIYPPVGELAKSGGKATEDAITKKMQAYKDDYNKFYVGSLNGVA